MSHPTVARVDLSAIVHNYRLMTRRVGPRTRVACVLKANAYGHGLAEVGRALADAGAEWFTVATLEEGVALRGALPTANILVLLPTLPGQDPEAAEAVIRHRLRPNLVDRADADALEALAERMGVELPVHVEIDTGMGRMGVPSAEAAGLLSHVAGCRRLRLEGVFTHFAEAEAARPDFARRQLDVFYDCLADFDFRGRPGPGDAGADDSRTVGLDSRLVGPAAPGLLLHAANSAAAVRLPGSRLNMVRCGLVLYGHNPSEAEEENPDGLPAAEGLRPAMRVVSRLVAVKRLPAGHSVGYSRTWTAGRDTVTGIVPVGYEDGYPRALSNNAVMQVAGRDVPVIGRVSMDQTVVDLTDVPSAAVGAEVTVISDAPGAANSLPALARAADTIPYELLCRLGNRIRRVYV
jgi:alanine racemase